MYQSYKKYSSKNPLIHCKVCRGVLLRMKEIQNLGDARIDFDMRCPHCCKNWVVAIIVGDPPIIQLTDCENT